MTPHEEFLKITAVLDRPATDEEIARMLALLTHDEAFKPGQVFLSAPEFAVWLRFNVWRIKEYTDSSLSKITGGN